MNANLMQAENSSDSGFISAHISAEMLANIQVAFVLAPYGAGLISPCLKLHLPHIFLISSEKRGNMGFLRKLRYFALFQESSVFRLTETYGASVGLKAGALRSVSVKTVGFAHTHNALCASGIRLAQCFRP